MEISAGIHRIEAPLGDRFVCVFALVGDRAVMIVDSGLDSTPREVIAPYLQSIGVEPERVRYVLSTHADFDHVGGNASARAMFPRADFLAHTLDRDWIEDGDRLIAENYGQFADDHAIRDSADVGIWLRSVTRTTRVDVELSGGERLRLADDWWIQVLHTPGHTRGHLSLWDARSGTVIVADAVLSDGLYTAAGQIAFPPTYRFVTDYLETVRTLGALGAATLLTSHYAVQRGADVAQFLDSTAAFVSRADAELQNLLQHSKALSLSEIIAALHGALGAWPKAADSFLAYPLLGHLEQLLEAGFIRCERRGQTMTYRWNGGAQ